MSDPLQLTAVFTRHGFDDFKWIQPRDIVVAQWVRMKCTFGCPDYGHNTTCPPNVPSVAECRAFIHEYTSAVVFHIPKQVDHPEDRHEWCKGVNNKLVKLERDVFLAGNPKAFLLAMDNCYLCAKCTEERIECKHPKLARPAPEALAIDVFSTVRACGYPIEVLTDYTQTMNRYAILLID
jgi:predicted metal-binding protein